MSDKLPALTGMEVIQAFSIYKPTFFPVGVSEDGMDARKLRAIVANEPSKLISAVPNFQNPSGVTYPDENRAEIARIIQDTKTILIEDDPYGDLRFTGEPKQSFKHLAPDNTIMLGSFSKTIVPGFRLGWIVASRPIMEKLIIAKQAADLHTCHFTQSIINTSKTTTLSSYTGSPGTFLKALNVRMEPDTSGWKSVKPEAVRYCSSSGSSNA